MGLKEKLWKIVGAVAIASAVVSCTSQYPAANPSDGSRKEGFVEVSHAVPQASGDSCHGISLERYCRGVPRRCGTMSKWRTDGLGDVYVTAYHVLSNRRERGGEYDAPVAIRGGEIFNMLLPTPPYQTSLICRYVGDLEGNPEERENILYPLSVGNGFSIYAIPVYNELPQSEADKDRVIPVGGDSGAPVYAMDNGTPVLVGVYAMGTENVYSIRDPGVVSKISRAVGGIDEKQASRVIGTLKSNGIDRFAVAVVLNSGVVVKRP